MRLATPTPVADSSPPRPIADNLWVLDRRIRLPGAVTIPTRATIVRLANGGLFLHALFAIDAPTKSAIESLGRVESVVAPNSFHYVFIHEAMRAFPSATLYLAPRLRERRPELPPGTPLGETVPGAWQGELDHAVFGPVQNLSEVEFYHRASRTLILADLSFNIRHAGSRAERWFWRIAGAWQRFGPSRTARWMLLRDPRAVGAFVRRVLEWDFDRIIVAHGEVLERDGQRVFREAFAKYLR